MIFRRALLAAMLVFTIGVALGEERLLTGNNSNEIHAGGGEIMDIAADGDLVLFYNRNPGQLGSSDLPFQGLYLRRLSTGVMEFVSDIQAANADITHAKVSDDGRYITWAISTDREIFWKDRQAGVTRQITAGQRTGREPFTVISTHPIISANGRYVAFASNSLFLEPRQDKLPAPGYPGVHLYDSVNQTIRVISLAFDGARITTIGRNRNQVYLPDFASFDMTPDAKYVVFSTDAANSHSDRNGVMFAIAPNNYPAVLRRDIVTGHTVLLNRDSAGAVSNALFHFPRISADGNRVVFQGENVGQFARGIVQPKMISTNPHNPGIDLYVKEVSTNKVWMLTRTATNALHTGSPGTDVAISADGSVVAFSSNDVNLTAGGSGSDRDVFRADLSSNSTLTLSQLSVSPTSSGNVSITDGPQIAANGAYVTFGTSQFAQMGFPGTSPYPHGLGIGTFSGGPQVGNTTSFETWALILPEGKRGPNDNPSGDGIANLLKYYIGSDARVPDLRHLPIQEFLTGDSLGFPGDTKKYMVFTVRIRRNLPSGYSWKVENAPTLDLLVSVPGPVLPLGAPVADGDYDIHRFRSFSAIGQGSNTGFMRLRVELP